MFPCARRVYAGPYHPTLISPHLQAFENYQPQEAMKAAQQQQQQGGGQYGSAAPPGMASYGMQQQMYGGGPAAIQQQVRGVGV